LRAGFFRFAADSLAWRFGLVIGLASGAIVVTMVWIHYRASREQLITQAHDQAMKHVQVAAGYVDETVGQVAAISRALAGNEEAKGSEGADPALETFLVNLLASAPGEELYSCSVAFDGQDWRSPAAFRRVDRRSAPRTLPATADFHGPENDWFNGPKRLRQLYISEPYFDHEGSRMTMISVSYPIVRKDGRFVGAASASMELSQIHELVQRIRLRSEEDKPGADHDYAFLVSRAGNIISHPDANLLVREGSSGVDVATLPEGNIIRATLTGAKTIGEGENQRMIFWAFAPVTGWKVVLSVPTRMILTPVRRLALHSAAIGGIGLLILLGVVAATVRSFTRPLNRLRSASENIEAGLYNLDTLDGTTGGRDELARLARSFQRMSREIRNREGRLEEMNANLEKTVEERTAALTVAEAEARKLALVASLTHNGVVIIGPSGKIEWVNESFSRLTGCGLREALGKTADDLLFPADTPPDILAEKVLGFQHRRPFQLEVLLSHQRTAGKLWLYIDAQPVLDNAGQLARFILILVDITKRKKAEEDARAAREAAEDANRTKSAFLANMSHELRTPMNAIIGYSEMLVEEAGDTGHEALVPDLEKIHSAGKHLLGLINDVLDLSKIEAGKMTLYLEEFVVTDMMRDVVATIQPLVEKNKNVVLVESPPEQCVMTADVTKVRQLLFNLLSNAAKFTQKGRITLTLERRVQADGTWFAFKVADTGIGMTPQQLAKMFQAFVQADASTTRKYGGTGLGLTISRNFCQLMGGDITVQSEPGKGTVFTAVLPERVQEQREKIATPAATPETTQPATTPEPAPSQIPAPLVLAIDDDPAMLELLSRNLIREGYAVRTAKNGREALEFAHELKPQLITLDVMMPSMDGWSVLTSLKGDVETRDIPVVVVSMVDDKGLGLSLGAADYLTKPIDRGQLAAILAKYAPKHSRPVALIVDDLRDNRQLLSRALGTEGWTIVEAENGRIGLELFAEHQPNLILLDLMMPEMDGFEFLRELRKREDGRSVPVVVATAKELTPAERDELRRTVQNCVEKGNRFTHENFFADVRRAIDQAKGDIGG
jgi:PAS domain S-box-containing protein